MKKSNSIKEIAKIFSKNVYKLHGFPKSLLMTEMPNTKGISGRCSSNILEIFQK